MREDAGDGFPTDYLLSRIRGRQTRLVSDWEELIARGATAATSDETIWGAFLHELAWLHAQMNRGLRRTFAPLFGLFEIKTIVLCLRNKAVGRTAEVERLLATSLLSEPLKEVLRGRADVRGTIAAVFPELEAVYAESSLQGFENALMRMYLQEIAATDLDAVMRTFFVMFTDLRNIVLLYKDLRWGIAAPSPFIAGGTVDVTRLQEIAARRDPAALDDLVRSVTGLDAISIETTEGALETILLRSMTKQLARMRHAEGGLATIVAYMWRIYVQARNLAVLHHSAELDSETVERELVL